MRYLILITIGLLVTCAPQGPQPLEVVPQRHVPPGRPVYCPPVNSFRQITQHILEKGIDNAQEMDYSNFNTLP